MNNTMVFELVWHEREKKFHALTQTGYGVPKEEVYEIVDCGRHGERFAIDFMGEGRDEKR